MAEMKHLQGRGFFSTSLALIAFGSLVSPLAAQEQAIARYDVPHTNREIPQILSDGDRIFYKSLFTHIDREQWDEFTALLEERESGLLHAVATAEYFTHANSPRISAAEVERWLEDGTTLPQAEQIKILGVRRGLGRVPQLPEAQDFVRQPSISKRLRPATTRDGTMPANIRADILDHIVNDDPDGARILLDGIDSLLSSEARAEWRQRVAWSYYIENDDPAALAMALTVQEGSGPWVAEGDWVAGLAAWRLGDCAGSASSFARSAQGARNVELRSAAHFWAGRAYTRCRNPANAQRHIVTASRYDETLYGMLALEQLGISKPSKIELGEFSRQDWDRLKGIDNVRVALALIEVGQPGLADEVLRHQVRIGGRQGYEELARLARALGLPATQLFMAYNAPRGMRSSPALRYPTAHWRPISGWNVDPSLAYAHALQESNFQTAAISPANARGLMQITPITVRQHAGTLQMNASYVDLNDPQVNLSFGQRNLEMLRDSQSTQGKLPKIMAAYNAGVTPVTRWNDEIRDFDDPLLYIESIPYWETRGYVAIVMRNYWMYERIAGSTSLSRLSLAQGQWPEFPSPPQQRFTRND
jgi:soluble lytic murein transglycosylase-like protein